MVIRENYLNTLIDAKDTEFIKVITGVRRSGKSTLLLMYKEYLLNNNVTEDRIIHINFESAMYDYIRDYKDLYEEINNKLQAEELKLKVINTICLSTELRQKEAEKIRKQYREVNNDDLEALKIQMQLRDKIKLRTGDK